MTVTRIHPLQTAPGQDHFVVTPHDTVDFDVAARALYVGGAGGNVSLVSLAGTTVVYTSLAPGTTLPVGFRRINVTNTTATDLVGIV